MNYKQIAGKEEESKNQNKFQFNLNKCEAYAHLMPSPENAHAAIENQSTALANFGANEPAGLKRSVNVVRNLKRRTNSVKNPLGLSKERQESNI